MNREIFPGGVYPLQGDVTSQAGSDQVTVVGIQNVPVASTPPVPGQVLIAGTGGYAPGTLPANQTVQVNGTGLSDDFDVAVNGISDVEELVFAIHVNSPVSPVPNVSVQVNGFPVSDDYSVSVNAAKPVTVNGV